MTQGEGLALILGALVAVALAARRSEPVTIVIPSGEPLAQPAWQTTDTEREF